MTLVLIDDASPAQLVPRVPEGEARLEKRLRDLIHDHPAVLPVHDLDHGYGTMVTVAKELNIPGVGFIDVVLMDELGRLVIVECKLWRNPQARREVVGQILDYARELARYGYEDLQRQVSIATKRQGNVLYELARNAGGTLSEAEFVDRVARDLAAGRFLLLVVGDGIAEGTRRIGEYLRDQPGLAFDFGLIEIAEYRFTDGAGREHLIVQPRILARTAVIERHVIRNEAPGIIIAPAEAEDVRSSPRPPGEFGQKWRRFVDQFVAGTRFDDPGQPAPRYGGNGWMKIPLPQGLYINAYRSGGTRRIGVSVGFRGSEGELAWEELNIERDAIDAEFVEAGLPAPTWAYDDVPHVGLTLEAATPWCEADDTAHRVWLGRVSNQFVNSFRPRLLRLETANS